MERNWLIAFAAYMFTWMVFGDGSCDLGSRADTSETFTTYQAATGRETVCLKCPPGSYVIRGKQCYPNSVDHCKCCPGEQFQTDFVEDVQSCADCDTCRQNEIEVQDCSSEANRKCECKEGMHFVDGEDRCQPHSLCEEGMGVISKGTSTRDTKCEPCLLNITFSNTSSALAPCQPCSECKDGEHETKICTPTTDAVCEPIEGGVRPWVAAPVVVVIALGLVVVVIAVICCQRTRNKSEHRNSVKRQCFCCQFRILSFGASGEEIECELFDYIAGSLGQDWKNFIRNLKFPGRHLNYNTIIDRAVVAEPGNLCEQIRYCLRVIKEKVDFTPEEFVNSMPEDYKNMKEGALRIVREHKTSGADTNALG